MRPEIGVTIRHAGKVIVKRLTHKMSNGVIPTIQRDSTGMRRTLLNVLLTNLVRVEPVL